MSQMEKNNKFQDHDTWIEDLFPPNKPIRWIIFIWNLPILSATILAFFYINRCLRESRHFDENVCLKIFSSSGTYGLENYASNGLFIITLTILIPLAIHLLRKNRFNWLKKTNRWKKEWDINK